MMRKDVFTAGEVAVICRMSRQTINRWLHTGVLKGYRPTENSIWRITRRELVQFMKSRGIPLEFLNGGTIKVLIIDDDKNLCSAIQRWLHNDSRFEFDAAHSGFTAGAKLESFKPDIVLLDIFLGDMDGREFLKYIRNHNELSKVKVIGISGFVKESDVDLMKDRGFDVFLQKPFDMEVLRDIILRVME
jgi:excisionase family DNA binding protein